MNPRIKFKISYQKDVDTFFCFVRDAKYDKGRSLNWAILKNYQFFRRFEAKDGYEIKKEIVEKFVRYFYKKNEAIIKSNLYLYEKNWGKKEKVFYRLVSDLFSRVKWPRGKYIAYPTMWGMFPRFLKDKTFQIPFRHKNPKYVDVIIAHEMLHFIFYDYFYKKHPAYKRNKYNLLVWHVSEIFNAVVQNSPKWLEIFGVKMLAYPEHKKIIKKLSKKNKWGSIKADNLVKDIVDLVDNSDLIEK